MKISQFRTHTKKAGMTIHGVHLDTIRALIRFQRRTGVDPENIVDFITLVDNCGLADTLEIGPELMERLQNETPEDIVRSLQT